MGTNFSAWMLKIAYYQVLEHRRKLNRQALRLQGVSSKAFAKVLDYPKALGIGAKLRGKGNRKLEGSVGYWDGRIDELTIFNYRLDR